MHESESNSDLAKLLNDPEWRHFLPSQPDVARYKYPISEDAVIAIQTGDVRLLEAFNLGPREIRIALTLSHQIGPR